MIERLDVPEVIEEPLFVCTFVGFTMGPLVGGAALLDGASILHALAAVPLTAVGGVLLGLWAGTGLYFLDLFL